MYLRVLSNWNSFICLQRNSSRPAAVGDLWNVGEVNIIGICRDVNGVEVDRPKEGQQASLSQPLIGDEKNCKCCMFFTCWDEMYNNKLVNLITNSYYAPYFLRQKYSFCFSVLYVFHLLSSLVFHLLFVFLCCMFFTCWDERYNNKLVNLITNSYYAPYFLRQKYSLNNRKYKSLWVREDLQKSLTWAIYKKKYINPFLLYVEFASTSWRT